MAPPDDCANALVESIQATYKKSTYPNDRGFISPAESLESVINQSRVEELLKQLGPISGVSRKDLVDFIIRKATKLLAILLVIDLRGDVLKTTLSFFAQNGTSDQKLPIDPRALGMASTLACCRSWSPLQREVFGNYQWRFLAPRFVETKAVERIEFDPMILFPFESRTQSQPRQGGFGTVRRVKVHAPHLGHLKTSCDVAIKQLFAEIDINDRDSPAYKAWEREAKALQAISRTHKHIVETFAIFNHINKEHFMFPWAERGNLRQFMATYSRTGANRDPTFVLDILSQLVGLASAIETMHKQRYRHGDLKPDNILIFTDEADKVGKVGVWKVADLGLAKFHNEATGDRKGPTTRVGHGTISYEPPETVVISDSPRSRLYDIWSMGCIILQLVISLLYGDEAVVDLSSKTRTPAARFQSSNWEARWDGSSWKDSKLHTEVLKLIRKMEGEFKVGSHKSPGAGTHALVELASLARERLLVVLLPPERGRAPRGCRAKADELHSKLKLIHENLEQRIGSDQTPPTSQASLQVQHPQQKSRSARQQSSKQNAQSHGYHHPLTDEWEILPNNDFASHVLTRSRLLEDFTNGLKTSAKVCDSCSRINFCAPLLRIKEDISDLKANAATCDLCRMRWNSCKSLYLDSDSGTVTFDKFGSHFKLNHRHLPVLTILRNAEVRDEPPSATTHVQIGLPRLPTPGSRAHIEILRQWLKACDEGHRDCLPAGHSIGTLPTRLINVGFKDSPTVRLYETKAEDSIFYLALSHPWGSEPHFCTLPENLDEHKKGIILEELPKTFRDAIEITRQLGLRYLWIDSICIVQGPEGDFNEMAKRMEDVFSQAYCVLAASSAQGQSDGFLQRREQRTHCVVPCNDESAPVYLCEFMDNFQSDVLESRLSQRAWVLQERALARRTIFFTDRQTYWECGDGIQCETLTKLQNKVVAFLGDPAFPKVAMQASHGGRIMLYQDLYTRYSRLEFSHHVDRPVAIAGLEHRLIRDLNIRGGFGVLDDGRLGLLRRSLLWRRADGQASLSKIDFSGASGLISTVSRPPTWSWMAYEGAIEYMNPGFDQVVWEEQEIVSPWSSSPLETWSYSGDSSVSPLGLKVSVRKVDGTKTRGMVDDGSVVLDNPQSTEQDLECVVLGRLKNSVKEESREKQDYLVMLVMFGKLKDESRGLRIYHRAGVGSVSGSFISWDGPISQGEIK